MPEKLIALGHIAEDIATPENVIGGGVSYSGITAKKLGFDVSIATKIPSGHRFINEFSQLGVSVITLPTECECITTFSNKYGAEGQRQQMLYDKQDKIGLQDLPSIPHVEIDGAIILIAPVVGEVDTEVIPHLSQYGLVAVSPQGYFRETGDSNIIFHREWRGFEDDLSHASVTILSDEDISVHGVLNQALLDRIASSSPVTILTKGRNGATGFVHGEKAFETKAFSLVPDETRDFDGAGDTFTGAFLTKFVNNNNDPYESAVFASLVAAIKISGISGRGIHSIPNKEQIERFVDEHRREYKKFLASNQVASIF